MSRLVVAVFLVLGVADDAAAEPAVSHAAYLELFGKGGLWGVGYDAQFHEHWAAGTTASFYVIDGQRVLSVSPYLAAYPLGDGRHRWFVHAGPQLVRVSTPSPVPEWEGTATTGIGAELSSGYEYRDGLLVRVFGMTSVGKGGWAPWLGVSFGWSL